MSLWAGSGVERTVRQESGNIHVIERRDCIVDVEHVQLVQSILNILAVQCQHHEEWYSIHSPNFPV